MPEWLKEEFQLKHFGYSDCLPSCFYESQWFNNRWIYCIIKFLFFGYWIAWFISNFVLFPAEITSQYWIFLTEWGVVILLIYFVFSFALVLYGAVKKSLNPSDGNESISRNNSDASAYTLVTDISTRSHSKLRWFHKVIWILFEVSFGGAIIITVAYWSLLADNPNKFDINNHAINTVIMFIDFVFNKIPIRLLHFFLLSFLAVVYTVFSLILHWTGYNSAIYPVLDWTNRSGFALALTLIIIFVVSPIVHGAIYGLYKLKELIYIKVTPNQNKVPDLNDQKNIPFYKCVENVAYENEQICSNSKMLTE